jgi:hypothetical protein
LYSCPLLQYFSLSGYARPVLLSDFIRFPKLRELHLSDCSNLQQETMFYALEQLEKLTVKTCNLEPDIHSFKHEIEVKI